jgi:hypothetical protein
VSPIPSSGFDPTGPVDEEDYRNASATVAINLIKSILPLKVSLYMYYLKITLFVVYTGHTYSFIPLTFPSSISSTIASSFTTFFFLRYLYTIVIFQIGSTISNFIIVLFHSRSNAFIYHIFRFLLLSLLHSI